jgi:nucleoside-diphosphate-sugar epimerase
MPELVEDFAAVVAAAADAVAAVVHLACQTGVRQSRD